MIVLRPVTWVQTWAMACSGLQGAPGIITYNATFPFLYLFTSWMMSVGQILIGTLFSFSFFHYNQDFTIVVSKQTEYKSQVLRGEKHNEYGLGPTLPLPLPLNSLVIPSQSRQLLRGIQAFFPALLILFSQTGNTKQTIKPKFKCHTREEEVLRNYVQPPATSSRSAHIPVSLQLIFFLGLVSFHCLKQKTFCEKTKAGYGRSGYRRHIWENQNKRTVPSASPPAGNIPLVLLEGASSLTPIISEAGSKPKSGKTALGEWGWRHRCSG